MPFIFHKCPFSHPPPSKKSFVSPLPFSPSPSPFKMVDNPQSLTMPFELLITGDPHFGSMDKLVFSLSNVSFVSLICRIPDTEHERVEKKFFPPLHFSDRGPICFGIHKEISTQQHEFTLIQKLISPSAYPQITPLWLYYWQHRALHRCLKPQMRKNFKLWLLLLGPKLRHNLFRGRLSC